MLNTRARVTMEKPVDKEKPEQGAGDVYFVLERGMLETAKVGKARTLRSQPVLVAGA